jgi:hypothetical protein
MITESGGSRPLDPLALGFVSMVHMSSRVRLLVQDEEASQFFGLVGMRVALRKSSSFTFSVAKKPCIGRQVPVYRSNK